VLFSISSRATAKRGLCCVLVEEVHRDRWRGAGTLRVGSECARALDHLRAKKRFL